MFTGVGVAYNRNYAKFFFDTLIFKLIRCGIIASNNVEIGGPNIWVETTYTIICSWLHHGCILFSFSG